MRKLPSGSGRGVRCLRIQGGGGSDGGAIATDDNAGGGGAGHPGPGRGFAHRLWGGAGGPAGGQPKRDSTQESL
ncbi:hypothetical protein DNK56_18570 [Streptomyces sp. AC1-42W]|nr:hypothetical protein DNK56_18570 [Streptomyces sp. AC1-42W]